MSTEEFEDIYKDFSIADLANAMKEAKDALDAAKKTATECQKHFDRLRLHVVPERMEDMGISSLNVTGVGRLSVTADLYAGIKAGQQDTAYQWLRDNGFGDLVKDFVHSSTMKAFIEEQVKEGTVLPEGLFKVEPFMRASLTKTSK